MMPVATLPLTPVMLPPVILPVAVINPPVLILPPVILPVALAVPPVARLPPVMVPVADTCPPVRRLPPVTLPVALNVVSKLNPVESSNNVLVPPNPPKKSYLNAMPTLLTFTVLMGLAKKLAVLANVKLT